MDGKANILVTRPSLQAQNLCQLLEKQGYNAVRLPTLEIVALETQSIRQQLRTAHHYHWLIFISANAVNFALAANGGKITPFSSSTIAAVGSSTKNALQDAGLAVALLPNGQYNSEGLLDSQQMHEVAGKSCLIVRGVSGRETLATALRQRGARVDYLEVYSRQQPSVCNEQALQLLGLGRIAAITITCGSCLVNLQNMVASKMLHNLHLTPTIVPSQRLRRQAQQLGFATVLVSDGADDAAMVASVLNLSTNPNWNNCGRR